MEKINDSSIVRTLKTLIGLNGIPRTARQIGLIMSPVISLNTCIKNISFIRREYGNKIIQDDRGRGAKRSNEFRYWINSDWEFAGNNYCLYVSSKSRNLMNNVIKERYDGRLYV